MTVVRELIVTLGFKFDEAKLKSIEDSIDNLKKLLMGVATVAAGAGAAIYGLTRHTAEYAAQIKNTSDAMGVSYDMFQKFSYAASLSGVKSEEFTASLRALNNAISGARYGAADMIMTFARTNVRYLDAAGNARKLEDVMSDLADSFSKMKDGPEKTAFAMKLFGEAGTRLLPTFARGRAGLREMGAEIEAFGGILTEQEVELGNTMRQEFLRVQAIAMSIVRSVGIAIFPTMSKAIQSFKAWAAANKEVIKQNLEGFMKGLAKILYWIWRTAVGIKDVIILITRAVGYLNDKLGFLKYLMAGILPLFGLFYLGKLAQGVYSVANAFLTMGRAAMIANIKAAAIPILIGALVAAAFLILEDFVAFVDGRPSVLGFLIKNWDDIMAKFKKAVDAAEAHIKNFITKSVSGLLQLFGATKTEADAAGKAVGNAFSSATGVVKSAIDTWVGALAELYPLAKKVAGAIASVVSGVLSGDIAKGNAKGWWSAIVDAAKDAANEIQKAFSIGVFHYLETELGNVLKIIKTTLGVLFPNIKAAVDVAVPIIDSTVRGVAKTSSDFNAPFVPGAMVPIFAPSTVASKTADRAPNYVQPIVTQTAHVTATINVPAGTTAKEAEGYVADGFGKAWESIRYHTGSALTPAIQY